MEEVLPRPPAQGQGASFSLLQPPAVADQSSDARGDGVGRGLKPTFVERAGDADWLGAVDQDGETDPGRRLRRLLRRLLRTGDGGGPAVGGAVLPTMGDLPPERGKARLLLALVAFASGFSIGAEQWLGGDDVISPRWLPGKAKG